MHCPVLRSHTLPNESKPSKRIELIWKVVEQVHLQSRQVLHHLERQQCTPPCCDLLDARPDQSFIETIQKRSWKWLHLSQLFQVPKTPRVIPYCCSQKPVKGVVGTWHSGFGSDFKAEKYQILHVCTMIFRSEQVVSTIFPSYNMTNDFFAIPSL